MMARLTAHEVSNASDYDGATALAEAVLLALNVGQGKRTKILLSPAVHPRYRAVVKTYLRGTHAAVVAGDEDGGADLDQLKSQLDQSTAALVIQNPNFFGQRSEEHTSELQSHLNLVCRLLLEKKKDYTTVQPSTAPDYVCPRFSS